MKSRAIELPRPARLHTTDRSVVVDRELFIGLLSLLSDLIEDRAPDPNDALPYLTMARLSLCLCDLLQQRRADQGGGYE